MGEAPSALAKRIQRRLEKLGKSMRAVSLAVGSDALIRNIMAGKSKSPRAENLEAIARELRTTTLWLLNEEGPEEVGGDQQSRVVKVKAHVQAGVFAESWEWDDHDWYEVAVPADDALLGFKLYAAETRGPSMNRRWPEGTVVVFTNVEETKESPVVGKRYIVEREKMGGEREHTVKRLTQDANGKQWLMPESDDPRFQTPIDVEIGVEGETVKIIGRVWYSVVRE